MAELMMLRLEGLLQSWGESSAWDNRGTASMPTKSGIVGLLACAMGLERGCEEICALSKALICWNPFRPQWNNHIGFPHSTGHASD